MQEHFEDELHVRKYGEFVYQSKEWNKERRFIFRVDFTKDGPDTRFVITNASGSSSRKIYDDKYCRRAQCENWIKDLKSYLKCDRTSCQEFEHNQFRLLLHVFAYILIWDISASTNQNRCFGKRKRDESLTASAISFRLERTIHDGLAIRLIRSILQSIYLQRIPAQGSSLC